MPTDLLSLRDAELRSFDATVTSTGDAGVVLDQTAFYGGRFASSRGREAASTGDLRLWRAVDAVACCNQEGRRRER